jgi:ABC-type spermidine/putrescine transport system permease subunit II
MVTRSESESETETGGGLFTFDIRGVWRTRLLYGYLLVVFAVVLAPVIYTVPAAIGANLSALTQELYVGAILNSFQLGLTVAVIATVLTTIAARFYRHVRYKNAYVLFMTLPLFVPGDTHAISVAVFAREIGVSLSFWTLATAHVFYVFPFAFLMVLATMAGLPQNIVSAAEDLGANEFRAFWDVELPMVMDGVISGFLVSFLLSLNEAPRASVLGGQFETISGVILSIYGSVGLDPTLYALNVFMVVFALVIISVILVLVVIRS